MLRAGEKRESLIFHTQLFIGGQVIAAKFVSKIRFQTSGNERK